MSQWLGAYGWGYAAAAFAAWTLVLAVLARIDRRRIDGENTWSKPFKFSSSLAIHFATFAVLTHHLPADDRNGAPLLSTFVAAFAAAGFAQAYITVQAARRRRSHFNTTTPIEATMLALTGLCAVVVLAPAVVIGLDALVDPLIGWTAAERAGVAIGLLAGSLLTTVTGFQMGSAGSHFVGRPSSEPRMMRLTGWSLDAPDLRPAHFLANHMMQAAQQHPVQPDEPRDCQYRWRYPRT